MLLGRHGNKKIPQKKTTLPTFETPGALHAEGTIIYLYSYFLLLFSSSVCRRKAQQNYPNLQEDYDGRQKRIPMSCYYGKRNDIPAFAYYLAFVYGAIALLFNVFFFSFSFCPVSISTIRRFPFHSSGSSTLSWLGIHLFTMHWSRRADHAWGLWRTFALQRGIAEWAVSFSFALDMVLSRKVGFHLLPLELALRCLVYCLLLLMVHRYQQGPSCLRYYSFYCSRNRL
ncbi:hypothetical protein BDV59DRAFT_57221 [Aspergillus ambiguus]|uniref:uncharacterized protein n=1 Tax=Aspergillus ambiguus TaxID=176160 RepID=UPI003CCCFCA6